MAFPWIDPNEYSFDTFLLFERFQIRYIFHPDSWRWQDETWKRNWSIALQAHPAVVWYFLHRCPECAPAVARLMEFVPATTDAQQIRNAEMYALVNVQDFAIYTTPEVMADKCDFISGWSKERLFELAELTDKIVLDVGAGSGRLTFAAAQKAAWVYTSEPVSTLREYMRNKIAQEGIRNVRVLDGFITALPFPDSTFDVVMSGHVVGDEVEREITELTRVCKPGGWLLDCPGDSERDMTPRAELTERGWEQIHYVGSFGKDVYLYRKQVSK